MTTPTQHPAWQRWFWPAFCVVLISDQITKFWLFGLPPDTVLPSWIHLRYNTGIAWSFFDRHPEAVGLVTLALIPVLTWVWWRWYRILGLGENLAFGLILGGALGNAVDRLILTPFGAARGVRDFISVDLHPLGIPYIWPTFNLADAGISVGFVILVLAGLRPQRAHAADGQSGVV
jgi:signal peptidase II